MTAFDWSEVPSWAVCVTTDTHGYVIAWDQEPKRTPGGIFYSAGRMSVVLMRPGYTAEVFHRPEACHAQA